MMASPQERTGARVQAVVRRARRAILVARALVGGLTWFGVCGGVWLVLCVLDNALQLPVALRLPLALAAGGVTLGGLWQWVVRPLLAGQSLERTALMLERTHGVGHNLLISSLQFETVSVAPQQKPFAAATVRLGVGALSGLALGELRQPGRLLRWGVGFLALLAVWTVYLSVAPRQAGNALTRYVWALGDVPPASAVRLTTTPTADIAVAEGADVPIAAEVSGLPPGTTLASYPELYWREDADTVDAEHTSATRVTLQPLPGKAGTYGYTFAAVRRSFAYRVFAHDTYATSRRVTVIEAPHIVESLFVVTPPAYVGRPASTNLGPPQAVLCLAGARLDLSVRFDPTVESAEWAFRQRSVPLACGDDAFWRGAWTATNTASYELRVTPPRAKAAVVAGGGTVSLLADRPPSVALVGMPASCTVMPGEKLPVAIEATDDYGLKKVAVRVRPVTGGDSPVVLREWDFGAAPGRRDKVACAMTLPVDASTFAPGSRHVLEAVARDFCPGNGPVASAPVLVTVKALNELALPKEAISKDVFKALDEAIAQQKKALDATRGLMTHLDDVWVDVLSGKRRTDREVASLIEAHARGIRQPQARVRDVLVSAGGLTVPGHERLVERLRELGRERAVETARQADGLLNPADKAAIQGKLPSLDRAQAALYNALAILKGREAKAFEAQKLEHSPAGTADKVENAPALQDTALKAKTEELKDWTRRHVENAEKRKALAATSGQQLAPAQKAELSNLQEEKRKQAGELDELVEDLSSMAAMDFGNDKLGKAVVRTAEAAKEMRALEKAAVARMEKQEVTFNLDKAIPSVLGELSAVSDDYKATSLFQGSTEQGENQEAPMFKPEVADELRITVAKLAQKLDQLDSSIPEGGMTFASPTKSEGELQSSPMSSAAGAGKMGDMTPDPKAKKSGRSGAGRAGQADGQMIGSSAPFVPDEEVAMPDRMSSSPSEGGAVDDQDNAPATSIGLGKGTGGIAEFADAGRVPPETYKQLQKFKGAAAEAKTSAQDMALVLDRFNLPASDLKIAASRLDELCAAAERGDGLAIRQAFSESRFHVERARSAVELELQRLTVDVAPGKDGVLVNQDLAHDPKGYADLIGAYFKALAERDSTLR